MHTRVGEHDEVVVTFEEGEVEAYVTVAGSQGWDLPDFVAKAVEGYYGLCLDLIDRKGG